MLYAGEIISAEIVEYIKQNRQTGALITGIKDEMITVCERN